MSVVVDVLGKFECDGAVAFNVAFYPIVYIPIEFADQVVYVNGFVCAHHFPCVAVVVGCGGGRLGLGVYEICFLR